MVTAFLQAQVWFPWQSEPGGKLVPGLPMGVECAQSNTQGLCLIPSSLSPFIPATPSVRGATLRKGAGGGNPTIRGQRALGAFQSSASPEAPPWGAASLLSLQACPPGSGGNGPMRRAAGTPGPRGWGDTLAGTLPSPTTLQPRDPSLLRLQGWDTSPGHEGLRGLE